MINQSLKFVKKKVTKALQFILVARRFIINKIENTCETLKLIEPEEYENYVYKVIAPSRVDCLQVMPVFNNYQGGQLHVYSPAIKIMKFQNAIITPKSDIIRLDGEVFWDKFFNEVFRKITPLDGDLEGFNTEQLTVTVRRPIYTKSKYFLKIDVVFSLCGVHSTHWGHFVWCYLPKIKTLSALSHLDQIVVLVPETDDQQLKDLIDYSIRLYGNYEILYVSNKTLVNCNQLYYCTTTTWITDHANYQIIADHQPTQFALDALLEFNNQILGNKVMKPFRRLYLPSAGNRKLTNSSEIQIFFQNLNFEIIDPRDLNLDDKIKLFSEASHVAGPSGSGHYNVLFCRPGTKVLALSYLSNPDTILASLCKILQLESNMLFGVIDESQGVHKEFTVPLQIIDDFLRKTDFLT